MVFVHENKLLCSYLHSQGFSLLHLSFRHPHCLSFCLLPRFSQCCHPLHLPHPFCFYFLILSPYFFSGGGGKEKERWILSHTSQDSNWGLDGYMPISRQKRGTWVWKMKDRTGLPGETSNLAQLLKFFIESLFWLELLTTIVCQTLAAV